MTNLIEKISEFLEAYKSEHITIGRITTWSKQKSINLDVTVKIKDGFASLNDCEEIHKLILKWAKKEGILNSLKTTVKSESINKVLFTLGDFMENIGKAMKLETREKINNQRNFVGFLKEIKDDIIYLKSADSLLEFQIDQIKKAVISEQ